MNNDIREKIIEKLNNLRIRVDAVEDIPYTTEKSFDIYEDDGQLMTNDEYCWMSYRYDLGDGIMLEITSLLDHRTEYIIYVDGEKVEIDSEIHNIIEDMDIDEPDIDWKIDSIIDDWVTDNDEYDSSFSFSGDEIIVYRKDKKDMCCKFNRI